MSSELVGIICLCIILLWGFYIGYNIYKYNKIIMKDRDHVNIQSKPLYKHRKETKKLKIKLFVSFLIIAFLLIVIAVVTSYLNLIQP